LSSKYSTHRRSDHGFNRIAWKVADLQQALEKAGLSIGRHAIRTIIKDAGYRWIKARKALTSKDPDYRTKLDHIQHILGSLAKDEGSSQSTNTVRSQ